MSDPLDDARALLQHAGRAGTAAERYILAHRAAVSTAAALVAVILPDRPPRSQPFGVWVMLANAARELGEDEGVYRREAAYFAQISQVTAAVRAGVTWLVADDEADDLLRRARYFLGYVSYTIQQRRAASG